MRTPQSENSFENSHFVSIKGFSSVTARGLSDTQIESFSGESGRSTASDVWIVFVEFLDFTCEPSQKVLDDFDLSASDDNLVLLDHFLFVVIFIFFLIVFH